MVYPVDIVNQAIHVVVDQVQDSLFTVILSISTLIVAIGTIIGLWKTRESNKLFALEIKGKFSPSFDFQDRIIIKRTDTGDDNLWQFSCYMYNVGNVSVSNISVYHSEYPIKTLIDEVVRNESMIKRNFLEKVDSTLEPQKFHFISYTFQRPSNPQDLRIVIWLTYQYLHYKADSVVFLDHFMDGKTGYAWFDNDYIVNKRKELKV